MLIEQIIVSSDNNCAYIIADEASSEAAIIDPSLQPEKVLARAHALKLQIKYLINTHHHADHTFGNEYILKHTKATLVCAAPNKGVLQVTDGSELKLGNTILKIISTPGHTADSICILVDNKLFTGDTLFVGDVGRTWSEKDAEIEFATLQKIMQLPDETIILPGHDYGRTSVSTIGEEKISNQAIIDVLRGDLKRFLKDK